MGLADQQRRHDQVTAGPLFGATAESQPRGRRYGDRVPKKSTLEQTVEIEALVADALEMLDQVRYSLKTLEDRLMQHAKPRGDDGQSESAG